MTTIKSQLSDHKQFFAFIFLATVAYTLLFSLLFPRLSLSPISSRGTLLVIPISLGAWYFGLRKGMIYAIFLILWQIFVLLPLIDVDLRTLFMPGSWVTAVFRLLLLTFLIGYIHDLRRKIQNQQKAINPTPLTNQIIDPNQQETNLIPENHIRWQLAVEESGDGFWDWDLVTGEVYFSPQWKSMLGFDDELASPLKIWEASMHPEDLPMVQAEIDSYLNGKTDLFMTEYRLKTKADHYIWVLARGKAQKDATGAIVRMIGTHSDITKYKHSEDAIYNIAKGVSTATGEQFFQSLVQYIGEVTLADTVFVGEFINTKEPYIQTIAVYNNHKPAPNFEYDLQHTPCQNVVGKTACIYRSHVAQRFPKDISLAEKGIEGYIGLPLFTAEGKPLGIIVTLYKSSIQNVNLAQSTIQIFAARAGAELERIRAESALRQSKEQLRQSQKMEAIGRLAGGIAHDFNNILTVIISYSDLLTRLLPPEENSYQHAHHIKEAGEKAATLTHQLLAFSRKQVLEPKVINVNQTILNIGDMLQRLIDENITLDFQLNELVNPIKADASQLELVIMNLIINAKDAMPNGGTLTISTETLALDKFTVKDDLGEYLPSGYYTTITIEDTGLGITEETLNRIFEPFFTTKEQGKGTGLGLAMVHGFVKQSGGSILVESDLNQGTSFKLFFPAARKIKMQDRVEADVIAPSAASGTETILLVEDEVDVRTITHDILQLFGYKVFACAPAEALLLCQDLQLNGNGRIHLLLTDIIMPQINGYELAQEMAQTCPDLKILYMSGYTNDILPQQDDLQPAIHFIPKPFTPQQLTQKVRSVLDQ